MELRKIINATQYGVNDAIFSHDSFNHTLESYSAKRISIIKNTTYPKRLSSNQIVAFTERELACIQLLRKSYTVKEIARHLSISPRTVEDRLQCIKEKLGCNRKSQIINCLDRLFGVVSSATC